MARGSPVYRRPASRRAALWETGLLRRPAGAQRALTLSVEQDMAELPSMRGYETMLGEYASMGIHPRSHLIAYLRDRLPSYLIRTEDLGGLPNDARGSLLSGDSSPASRRQHHLPNPLRRDRTLSSSLWPAVFEKYRHGIRAPVLMVWGRASGRQGVMNIVAARVRGIKQLRVLPPSRSWR